MSYLQTNVIPRHSVSAADSICSASAAMFRPLTTLDIGFLPVLDSSDRLDSTPARSKLGVSGECWMESSFSAASCAKLSSPQVL